MNRIVLLLLLTLLPLATFAQRCLVVCDVESLEPISEVSVRCRSGVEISDSLGYFCVPDSSKSLLCSHVNYESRLLNLDEVRDTVFLVPKYMSVREVVVFGKGKDDEVRERMNKMLKIDKKEAELIAADPSSGGNLLELVGKILPKRKSRAQKRKEKAREIIENY